VARPRRASLASGRKRQGDGDRGPATPRTMRRMDTSLGMPGRLREDAAAGRGSLARISDAGGRCLRRPAKDPRGPLRTSAPIPAGTRAWACFARAGLASGLACFLALPAAAELQRCRAISDERSRLGCYDALADGAASRAAAPEASGTTPAPTVSPPAAVRPGSAPPGPTAAASAPARTAEAAAASAQADATDAFGLGARNVDGGLRELRSHIEGRIAGWGPNSRFVLANGQVWQVTDGSSAVIALQDPAVRIRRGALSGYVMEIEGLNRAPRVRRVE
jgi:hypothetical protein